MDMHIITILWDDDHSRDPCRWGSSQVQLVASVSLWHRHAGKRDLMGWLDNRCHLWVNMEFDLYLSQLTKILDQFWVFWKPIMFQTKYLIKFKVKDSFAQMTLETLGPFTLRNSACVFTDSASTSALKIPMTVKVTRVPNEYMPITFT